MQVADDTLTQKWVLNPHLKAINCGDDEIVVKHGGRSMFSRIIKDDGQSGLLGKIIRGLARPASLGELHEQKIIPDEQLDNALQVIDYLRQENVIVNPDEEMASIYLRSILSGTNALSAVTVALVGAGYLGARIAEELARIKVGKILAIDDRQSTNPEIDERYFNYGCDLLRNRRNYAEALADHLASVNYRSVEAVVALASDEERVRRVIQSSNIVVTAFETLSSKTLHTINKLCIEQGKPWMSVCVDGSEATIGPLFVPGETCCYNEFEIQHESAANLRNEYLIYREALDDRDLSGTHFVFPPYLNIASGFAAIGLARFLSVGKTLLVGRCLRMDFETMSVDYEEVLRLPRCPACKDQRPYRHLFL